MGQLPLALRLQGHATLESFVHGANTAAVEHIKAVARGLRQESVWLAGATGAGKSHLLIAACRIAGEAGLRPMYFALRAGADPGILAGLDDVDLLALDDLHRVGGQAPWEAALFSAINARLERGGLLLAADRVPRDCGFGLADLASRAASAAVYRLRPLDDDDLHLALTRHASARGLSLDDSTASYLLQRVSRDIGALTAWLDRIDRFSLAAQRRITIPLVREVIEAAPSDSA